MKRFERQKTWSSRDRKAEASIEESWYRRSSYEWRSSRRSSNITDEDVEELRGCIDLGFTFADGTQLQEEDDLRELCNTLPALNLYCAINRQLGFSPLEQSSDSSATSVGLPCLRRSNSYAGREAKAPSFVWSVPNPGERPQEVKTKLKHWARVVACSLRQSC